MYWVIWILVLTIGVSDSSNPLVNAGYNQTININSSGFTSDEIDTGFTFMSFIAVLGSIGRFIGLALFGITPAITGLSQIIFSTWSSAWTLFTIGFIIDAIWSG